MKVRIKFAKNGVMKYIGHLDIMRYFQKCIRKANVDIAYSGGFSPHQIMSFASPLGVGLESTGEYFDIELNSGSASEVLHNLNNVMVPGMEILSVKKLPDDAMNAMASIAAARYQVYIKSDFEPECCDASKVDAFLAQKEIVITKKTKKSEIEFDLRPHIFDFKFDGVTFDMTVDASSSGNIKPLMVINEYLKLCNVVCNENKYQVVRIETYTNKDEKLVALDAIGEDF